MPPVSLLYSIPIFFFIFSIILSTPHPCDTFTPYTFDGTYTEKNVAEVEGVLVVVGGKVIHEEYDNDGKIITINSAASSKSEREIDGQ